MDVWVLEPGYVKNGVEFNKQIPDNTASATCRAVHTCWLITFSHLYTLALQPGFLRESLGQPSVWMVFPLYTPMGLPRNNK